MDDWVNEWMNECLVGWMGEIIGMRAKTVENDDDDDNDKAKLLEIIAGH